MKFLPYLNRRNSSLASWRFFCPACDREHVISSALGISGLSENLPTVRELILISWTKLPFDDKGELQHDKNGELLRDKTGRPVGTVDVTCISTIIRGRIIFSENSTHSLAGSSMMLEENPCP